MTGRSTRVLLAALLAAGLGGAAAAERLTARASETEVTLGATFEILLTFEGEDEGRIVPPALPPGLEGLSTSQSSQIRIVNGRISRTTALEMHVRALRPGEYVIPPAEGHLMSGRVVRSEPIQVSVRPAAAASPEDRAEREKGGIFLRAELAPREVYVGEALAYAARVYLREGHRHARPPQAEAGHFDGFRVDAQEFDPTRGRWVDLESGRFSEFDVDRKILVPLDAGEHLVLPGKAHVVVEREGQGYRRRSSIFGIFRDTSDLRQGAVEADPVTVKVSALPEAGRPRDFSGIVGRGLKAHVSVDRPTGEVGEPLEYRILLTGQADLRGLKDPRPRFPPTVTVFDSKGESKLEWGDGGVRGEARFEYVLVPAAPGTLELPPFQLSWFDASRGRYATLEVASPAVQVTGEAAPLHRALVVPPPTAAGQGDEEAARSTIRFLREEVGDLPPKRPPLHRRTSGRLAFGLLLLAAVAVEAATRYRERYAGDAAGLRASRAAREARRGLGAVDLDGDPREACGALAAAVREYVAAKSRRATPGLTGDELREILAEHAVPEDVADRGVELLGRLERGRYAPVAAGDVARERDAAREWVLEVERCFV